MASYNVKVLQDKNSVLLTISETFRVSADVGEVIKDISQILDTAISPMYYISDVRNMKVTFSDVVMGLGKIALPGGVSAKPLLVHPNIKVLLLVVEPDSSIMKVGAKAVGQNRYGAKKVTMFSTLEEAFEYVARS